LYIEINPNDYEFLPPKRGGKFFRFLNYLRELASFYGGVYLIIILCVLFYFISIIGSVFSGLGLEEFISLWASNNYKMIKALDSYYRLITAIFVHFGILHLLLNMIGVYILGSLLERFWNRTIVFIVFLISGILSNIASFYILSFNSGGASGGVFGLMGSAFSFFYANNQIDKSIRYYMLRQIGNVIILNVIISLLVPSIDYVGHLGGLFSGAILGFIIVKINKRLELFYFYLFSVFVILVSLVLSLFDVIKLLSL